MDRPNRLLRARWLAVLLPCLASLSACARDCAPQLHDGWIRMPPGEMAMMAAGFARIDNPCPAAATIVGARSPAFASASLHETRVENGVSRMRAMPEVRLAPGATATLEPGGLHLMLMQPRMPLAPGNKVQIEFALKDGRTLRGEFEVRKAGE